MRILAIETSCDETGIAIVDGVLHEHQFEFTVVSNVLLSQAQLHAAYGGVYPTLAKREHEKNLPVLLHDALNSAGFENGSSIDALCVTSGPGLEPALWSGITFAQQLSQEWRKPLFGVNHMEGHLLSSMVHEDILKKPSLPILGLLISGGHTQFALMDAWLRYTIVGDTVDDAVGEAFDKVARMLSLPYPGGPHISKHAATAREKEYPPVVRLPRPMLNARTCDMSFSGLKTAALYALRDLGGIEKLSDEQRAAFAREFEDAAADVFVAKTRQALGETNAQHFVIGGGVAANSHIRSALTKLVSNEFPDVTLHIPSISITGDNAIMIAQAALVHFLSDDWQITNPPHTIKAHGNTQLPAAVS